MSVHVEITTTTETKRFPTGDRKEERHVDSKACVTVYGNAETLAAVVKLLEQKHIVYNRMKTLLRFTVATATYEAIEKALASIVQKQEVENPKEIRW